MVKHSGVYFLSSLLIRKCVYRSQRCLLFSI